MKHLLKSTVVLMCAAGIAQADTISFDYSNSGGFTLFVEDRPGDADFIAGVTPFTLDAFDVSLGTLTRATLTTEITVTSDLFFFQSAATGRVDAGAVYDIPADPADHRNLGSASVTSSVGCDPIEEFCGETGVIQSADSLVTTDLPLIFGELPTIFLLEGAELRLTDGYFDPAFADMRASFDYRFTLTYEYDPIVAPVPLPAGLPLLVSGVGLMAWVRSRRRA